VLTDALLLDYLPVKLDALRAAVAAACTLLHTDAVLVQGA
jgi:hypothetical protein